MINSKKGTMINLQNIAQNMIYDSDLNCETFELLTWHIAQGLLGTHNQ